jgi:anti-anti-sigma factor
VEQVDPEAIDTKQVQVVTAWDGARTVVTIAGELDLLTAQPLVRSVADLNGALNGDAVVMDLSKVSFIDATGYSALVEISRHLDGNGSKVMAINIAPQVERFLQLVIECGYHPPFEIDYPQS